MATYLPPGSNVKGDAIQTLYLMNPSYGGYTDPPNPGNMVLIGPGSNPVGNVNPSHQQQSYSGYLLPGNVPQQSHIANTSISHQNVSPEMFTSCGNSHGYSWNGGNELMFIPSSDIREENQALATRLSSIAPPEQQPSSEIRNITPETFRDQQVAFISNEVSLSEGMQEAPSGAGQTLSLSISPQPSMILNQLHHQPYPIQHANAGLNNTVGFGDMMMMSTENNYVGKCERIYTNQWMTMDGASNSALKMLRNVLPSSSDFQEHPMSGDDGAVGHGATGNNRHVNGMFPASSPRVDIYSSKYLKCAQELLNEVVSVGKDVKGNSSNASTKVQSWTAHTTFQDKDPTETGGKDGISSTAATWVTGKDIVPCVPNNTAGLGDQNVEHNAELTTAQKQEIQMKKSKLMSMLDEVEQRYRQYHHQMQMVVAAFESMAGLGAARAYTALALQTISRHFRCLKDAIRGQVRAACKALGDRDEVSRLRFIDRHLRQQRALQQLGMVPHHPWRPQRGLPERSVSVLRAWLFEHFLHPYPKDSDKVLLARQTGLTRNQVSNWFINARVRLWKPMVEEMYAEEMKEPTEGVEECNSKPNQGDGNPGGESARKNNCIILDSSGSNNGQNFSKSVLRPTLAELKDEAFSDVKKNVSKEGEAGGEKEEGEAQGRASEVLMIMHQENSNNMKPLESFLFQEKGQGAKKARNGDDLNTSPFLASNLNSNSTTTSSTQCGYKAEELHDPERPIKQRDEVENNATTATATGIAASQKHLDMEYGMNMIPTDSTSLLHHEKEQNLRGFGAFQSSGLNRYMNESIANASYGSINNNGVSLTLGLQQHGGHGHMDMVMRRQDSDGLNAASNFFDIHDVAAAANSNFPWQLPRAGSFNSSRRTEF